LFGGKQGGYFELVHTPKRSESRCRSRTAWR
jgi:hypothetical protein